MSAQDNRKYYTIRQIMAPQFRFRLMLKRSSFMSYNVVAVFLLLCYVVIFKRHCTLLHLTAYRIRHICLLTFHVNATCTSRKSKYLVAHSISVNILSNVCTYLQKYNTYVAQQSLLYYLTCTRCLENRELRDFVGLLCGNFNVCDCRNFRIRVRHMTHFNGRHRCDTAT